MRDLLCQNLPGYPDNIARGSDGLIWVAIGSPTDPLVERLQRSPMPLRKAVTRSSSLMTSTPAASNSTWAGEVVPQNGQTSACLSGFQFASAPQAGQ